MRNYLLIYMGLQLYLRDISFFEMFYVHIINIKIKYVNVLWLF